MGLHRHTHYPNSRNSNIIPNHLIIDRALSSSHTSSFQSPRFNGSAKPLDNLRDRTHTINMDPMPTPLHHTSRIPPLGDPLSDKTHPRPSSPSFNALFFPLMPVRPLHDQHPHPCLLHRLKHILHPLRVL